MLPAGTRLRTSPDFTETQRRGRRAGRPALVVSVLADPAVNGLVEPRPPARVGFVVGRRVGGAVVRNRVRRRLRHLMADRLKLLPAGSRAVVRALPGAAGFGYEQLARELDILLARTGR
jgi:ribonuclease P protein component